MVELLLPALFDYTERGVVATPNPGRLDERLSLGVSVMLILVYVANLLYTLVTHRDVFAFEEEHDKPRWSLEITARAGVRNGVDRDRGEVGFRRT